ncbi:hypothetical protein SAMN02982929_06550 [Saccharopolyspora kobensis]|uniref:Lipoprotein LprG n=1 Tax=Saccharopolyspora kobensis TaxID=146035 RepID=A0A1H6EHV5_9PSEU|nr:hypothetical protein [Saccharopolyspora kobensis]SEG96821.1 hypothetical protein SAMN02982929_06550 [Saccharopolyspora kobensis]SFE63731.1 hypothetical protein SAMN05216506_1135 [Saccharopolyspora kobensis]
MRRIATALTAAALAATLGACSQGGTPTGTPAAGDTAPIKDISSLVKTAKTSMDEQKTVTVSFAGTGPIAQLYASMKCEVDVEKTAMGCTGGPSEMVVTTDGIFMKSPQLAQLGGDPSKPWLKVPANDEMAQQFGELGKIGDFEAMLPAGSTITSTSEEQVDGKDTTRYEVTTDLQQASANASGAQQAGLKIMLDSGVTELKQTVWVDSDGLPVKIDSTTPALKFQGQEIPESQLSMRYSDWGKPVQITVPPAEQVQDMPSIPGMPG